MKGIKKSWFTLVELIVVITILAILWTIAFISLQGYTADARNSKRTSDLSSIQTAMTTTLAWGQPILSFITPVIERQFASANLSIAWTWVSSDNYAAWTVNFALLNLKAEEFKDPIGQDYMGWVTNKKNWQYELAATIENWSAAPTAKVTGTYFARAPKTISWSVSPDGRNFFIQNATDANYFSMNDTVTIWSSNYVVWKVTWWTTVMLITSASTWATSIKLAWAAEWKSLIKSVITTNSWVVDWTTELPYKIN